MGVSPLHLATQYNRTTVVEALLQRGANIDLLSQNDGATALYYASGHHYVEIARLLLAAGASPHIRQSRAGGFPLLYAAMTGDLSMVRLLLEYHARVLDQAPDGLRPLHAACAVGAVPVVRALLTPIEGKEVKKGGVSSSQILLAPGPHGQSALHVSISNRMNPVTYLLLQHAQTIHKTLHIDAATPSNGNHDSDSDSNGDDESFTLSSFVEIRDDVEGATALHIAARKGGQNPDAISLLLAFGADVEAVMDGDDTHCETPLYLGNAVTQSLDNYLYDMEEVETTHYSLLSRGYIHTYPDRKKIIPIFVCTLVVIFVPFSIHCSRSEWQCCGCESLAFCWC